jgi:hypothetical protein
VSTFRFTVQGDTIPDIEATVQEQIRRVFPDTRPVHSEMDVRDRSDYPGMTIDKPLVAEVIVHFGQEIPT